MELVSTVSSKTQEFLDLPIGAIFARYADQESLSHTLDNRAFVKINKRRAVEIKEPFFSWDIQPYQLVRRIWVDVQA